MLRILLVTLATLFAVPAQAELHEVEMLNRNAQWPMPYAPDFLRIAPGDTVRFVPTAKGHNAATIDSMLPEGATPFKSRLGEVFEITLTAPGIYGIKCSPHFAMGMVMLIAVGDAPLPSTLPQDLPPRARQRFDEILARIPAP